MENDGCIVGAIILIFSRLERDEVSRIRCHITSWYVEPRYRPLAATFFARGIKHSGVTYVNTSARPAAIPIVRTEGFAMYAAGQFISFPLLSSFKWPIRDKVQIVEFSSIPNAEFDHFERKLLIDHAKFGCISLWCVTSGQAYPFVFMERPLKGFIPGLQLVYCQDVASFARFARPLGLFLALRRKFVVRVDSNGPIPGLSGIYVAGMEPRYFKGSKPQLGDLAYTQAVMCPFLRATVRVSKARTD